MRCGDYFTKRCTLGTIGLTLAGLGFMMAMFWADFFTLLLGKELALRSNGRTYDAWKQPPIPLNLDIYMYNWTNPHEIKNKSVKPRFQELGPYRFIDKPDKVDIVFHPENSTVSYRRKNDFYFDAEGSKGSLNDQISTLNVVALSAGAKGKWWSSLLRTTISIGLNAFSQPISVQKTADELLFTGYEDDMIDVAREMPLFGDDVEVPFDRFGWFYTRNGSADLMGHFNVYTGEEDIGNVGQMYTWNYKTHSGFFPDQCGMINGSGGEFYPPKLKIGGSISLFTPDMCRSLTLDYVETTTVYGIEGYKYSGGLRSVDNGTQYPENRCFCGGTKDSTCVPSGVMNISSCRFGTPVFMSYPHFFNADPFYINQVEGITPPDPEKHEFYIILEPTTGVALEVAARFQLNILIEEFPGISLYRGVRKSYLPLLWFEQKVKIPEEVAHELKFIPTVVMIGHIIAGVIFAIGLIMAFWVPINNCIRRCHGELKCNNKTPKPKSTKLLPLVVKPSPIASKNDNQAKDSNHKYPEVSPLLQKKEKETVTNPAIVLSSSNEEKEKLRLNSKENV
ncbi:protein peste-like [Condylostylus longicornis]|uniref:protein peste-like n=1 Tax=Condylostylus longicornis TaxID=2530218 RepID=UPI00244DB2F9|nr:protein peste-like [Condylostylus longicornis]XP_055375790.1 protein peste-like [Condylostylus longicornis]XP_055375791.1 protein peste-like [Condylostylus longicornis]XP_055375792.1 protein peste-like [Condylostylus longicornis]